MTPTWIDSEDWPEDAWVFHGGDRTRPTWEEYVERWENPALGRELGSALPMFMTAERMADGYFRLSDGTSVTMTQRACADVMAAVVDQRHPYEEFFLSGLVLAPGTTTAPDWRPTESTPEDYYAG